MIALLIISFLVQSIFVSGFTSLSATRYRPVKSAGHQHLSASDDQTEGVFDTFDDELDEVLLRVNFSHEAASDDDALDAVRQYTKSFPFAAVLPVQPLTYLPVRSPDGEVALKVTFLRKKTEEKDSKDGGMLFQCELEDGNSKRINLIASRITKGQTVTKIFSEKQIVTAFIKGLGEARGKEILGSANVRVESVFHEWISL